MKTIILCGGIGTRLKEETEFKPKPMVLIGGKPILWHIMKIYSHWGYNKFILALGYKGDLIEDYFSKNQEDSSDIIFAKTGLESQTGKRILMAKKHITEDEFMVTYGDGVADINIKNLVAFHRNQKTIGTITGVHPYSKYGLVKIDEQKNLVVHFEQEPFKPLTHDYVSGGFMVFNKKALDYFDEGPMESGLIKLTKEGQLSIYRHEDFWKSMDTYKEMEELNELWQIKKPWAVWEKRMFSNEK